MGLSAGGLICGGGGLYAGKKSEVTDCTRQNDNFTAFITLLTDSLYKK